jgi:hypothetical protein
MEGPPRRAHEQIDLFEDQTELGEPELRERPDGKQVAVVPLRLPSGVMIELVDSSREPFVQPCGTTGFPLEHPDWLTFRSEHDPDVVDALISDARAALSAKQSDARSSELTAALEQINPASRN